VYVVAYNLSDINRLSEYLKKLGYSGDPFVFYKDESYFLPVVVSLDVNEHYICHQGVRNSWDDISSLYGNPFRGFKGPEDITTINQFAAIYFKETFRNISEYNWQDNIIPEFDKNMV
jgi:hypothetical protein